MWARVLAWIVLIPAALSFILGVRFIVQGFGPETLAGVGFIVGPFVLLIALAIAVPAGLFLRRGGRTLFTVAMVIAAVSTSTLGYFLGATYLP